MVVIPDHQSLCVQTISIRRQNDEKLQISSPDGILGNQANPVVVGVEVNEVVGLVRIWPPCDFL